MTRILVVDDSAVDRALAEGLLSREGLGDVVCCVDGASALQALQREAHDLVLTDLVMPGLDGLALTTAVRTRFPEVPVVLMTSQGSETLAAEALRAGAASYIPKDLLANTLGDVVRGALALRRRQRDEARLLGSLVRSESTFLLENDAAVLSVLVRRLQEEARVLVRLGEAALMQMGVALQEALVNAAHHGNLEMTSELRLKDLEAYRALLEERRRSSPYRERKVRVEARFTGSEARFLVQDEGPGFDWRTLPDCTDPENLARACGRGVTLMRSFMDEVRFNEAGNAVTMVKRAAAAA